MLIIWWFVGCSEKYCLRLSSDDWFGWMLKRYGGDYLGQSNILWPSTCMEGEQAVVKIILLTHNDILVSESLYHSSRRTFCVMPRSTATAPIPLCHKMGSVHFGPLYCSKMFLKGVDRVGWRYYWAQCKNMCGNPIYVQFLTDNAGIRNCPQNMFDTKCDRVTPWITVILEQLLGPRLVKKFPAFYAARRFITAFTTARHLFISWATSIQWTPPPPLTSWRSTLILSSHQLPRFPNCLFPSGFPSKNQYTLLTCYLPAHLTLFYSITHVIFGEGYRS